MKKYKIIVLLLIITINISGLFGQYFLNPRSISLANTYATQARGGRVLGWNPANLGFSDNPKFTMNFGILPIIGFPNVYLNNSTISPNFIFQDFLTGKHLEQSDKDALLDKFPDDGIFFDQLIQAEIINLSIGRWAFSMGAEIAGDIVMPKGIFDFVFNGNEFGVPIDLSNLDAQYRGVLVTSLAHGREIKVDIPYINKLCVGGAIKVLGGLGYTDFEKMNATITMDTTNLGLSTIQGDILAKVAAGGLGFALDFGISTEINKKMKANLSLNNLFGNITWGKFGLGIYEGKDVIIKELTYYNEIASKDLMDDLKMVKMDSLFKEGLEVDTTIAGDNFITKYPAYLLLGFQYDVLENLKLFTNFRQYFSEDIGISTTPQLSLACEYKPAKVFPIRLGFSFGGKQEFQWGIGSGLNFKHYTFDFGFSQTGGMFNNARGMVFSMGQSLVF